MAAKKKGAKKPRQPPKKVALPKIEDMAPIEGPPEPADDCPILKLHRERAKILRSTWETRQGNERQVVTPKQREWLKALPEHHYQERAAAKAIGVSCRSTMDWKTKPHIRRLLAIELELYELKTGVSGALIQDSYMTIIGADITDYYTDDTFTALKPRVQWTPEMKLAVQKISRDRAGNPVIDFYSRMDALDRLSKFRALGAADRVDVTSNGRTVKAAPLVITSDDPTEATRQYREFMLGET